MSLLEYVSYTIYGLLFLLSLIVVGVGIFKAIQFARLGVGRRREADNILDDWLNGRVEQAINAASNRKSVLSRVLQAVFSGVQARPSDVSYAEELSRQTALIELATLNERMRSLEMVVQAAPMLGLLGTVLGMIDAFGELAGSDGSADATQLADGIYLALTTTAAGLAIALIAYFIATWLESRIDRERNMMEALMSAALHGRVDPNSAAS